LNKKAVLITGSSTGFRHATAKLFADKGWNVVATMRDVSAPETWPDATTCW
jgi:NAD(P)-dependent dehydrogenase (short-subunit alcohol dehydrogenase family)